MPPKFTEAIYREIALAMFDVDGFVKIALVLDGSLRKFQGILVMRKKAFEFIRHEETETGILVRRGEGDLAFWHLSFQEYLAAKGNSR